MRVAFIGFGEAGQALSEGFLGSGASSIAAWDILFADRARGAPLRAAAERIGVRMGRDAVDAALSTPPTTPSTPSSAWRFALFPGAQRTCIRSFLQTAGYPPRWQQHGDKGRAGENQSAGDDGGTSIRKWKR